LRWADGAAFECAALVLGHATAHAGCHLIFHGESQASVDHRATVAANVRRNEPVTRDAEAGLSSLEEVMRPLDI